jgi:hypothetical protein
MYGLADSPVALAAWMLNHPRTMGPRLMAASRARSDQPGEVGTDRTREAPGGTAPLSRTCRAAGGGLTPQTETGATPIPP